MISWSAAADLADVERRVPLGDRLEVRRRPAGRRSRGSPSGSSPASSTTQPGAARQRAPDAERGRERLAAPDRPVAGAQQPERRPAGPR